MYIYIYIYIYTCVYTCVYIYIYIYIMWFPREPGARRGGLEDSLGDGLQARYPVQEGVLHSVIV